MQRTTQAGLIVLLLAIGGGGCESTGISDKNLNFLGPTEALEEIQGSQGILGLGARAEGVWVDARSAMDFSAGHIPGAINLPLDRATTDHQQLSDYGVVVVYGASYNDPKAEALSKRLMQLGHEEVHTLRGGYQAWTEAGHETEPGQ